MLQHEAVEGAGEAGGCWAGGGGEREVAGKRKAFDVRKVQRAEREL